MADGQRGTAGSSGRIAGWPRPGAVIAPPASVSIVVPAFNAGPYVAEAIESVLSQDYAAFEVIVVDDGSTDDSPAIVGRFADRVTVLRQANAGQSAALTAGWARASGTLLGYLSADDRLRPGALAAMAQALVDAPEAVLAYPDFGLIDASSSPTGIVTPPDYDEDLLIRDLHCLPGPGALFRRDAYERAGPWDATLRQVPDLDFFLRLALLGPFVRVPQVLADYRKHAGAATYRPASADRADEPLRVVERYFRRPDLPERVQRRARAATANALLLSAVMHGTSRRSWLAVRRFVRAGLTSPATLCTRKTVGYVGRSIAAQAGRWR
ncbi:MAG: glycosyltransferase [Vicinamibacteraceae bacterium]